MKLQKYPVLSKRKIDLDWDINQPRLIRGGLLKKKERKRWARLENRVPKTGGIPICDIRQSFRSAGLMFSYQVATIGDLSLPSGDIDYAAQNASWVSPCFPDTKLTNWEIIEIPVTIKSGSK
ncbi:hypothetical protein SESBI_14948 [Sesbania bispinosa]|nr:hypothetical protein SESBI_14948 [Sesbania bispinosa]